MPTVVEEPAGSAGRPGSVRLTDERAASSVTLVPERGALVTSFVVGGRELLFLDESTLLDRTKNVRGGIPVLFPSPGKLEGDAFVREGRHGRMKQHGFARTLPWRVVRSRSDEGAEVTLALVSSEDTLAAYPWAFRVELTFRLSGPRLRIGVEVENGSNEPMPFGFGFHPYFVVADKARARIETRATRAFDNVTKTTGPFRGFDFTAAEVDIHLLDHPDRNCVLTLPDGAGIEVSASPEFGTWVVWALSGRDFICLEPWTAPGNALNTGAGLQSAGPGERRELWVEVAFAPRALHAG